ncbi:techylectin-5B-like [Limulus polyphemus]|uniref:Techylectin-5B-like n=1 Tax=Limulus polyphemus TaxID=6850 RepID=A0ABM1S040_LIMPO|nr:techylectin-5B-like [Limulus polyphemus]
MFPLYDGNKSLGTYCNPQRRIQANVHHHTASHTVGSLEGIVDSLSSTVEELTDLAKQRITTLEGSICSKHNVFHTITPISINATQIREKPLYR